MAKRCCPSAARPSRRRRCLPPSIPRGAGPDPESLTDLPGHKFELPSPFPEKSLGVWHRPCRQQYQAVKSLRTLGEKCVTVNEINHRSRREEPGTSAVFVLSG